jgi:hypothetical protein
LTGNFLKKRGGSQMKYFKTGLFLGMAFSLLFPVYSMADMKLTVMTPEGYPVTSSTAVIKNFFATSEGLTVVLSGGIFATDPDIGLTKDGTAIENTIETTVGAPVSFQVVSDTQATITATIPPGCGTFSSPNYSWLNPSEVGNYLVLFTATDATANKTSTLIALIKVNPPGYTLTVSPTQANPVNGYVTAPKYTGFSATSPETVQVTAVPASGYRLASWGGALSGTTNPASLLMNGNKTVTATFELIPANQYALTVSKNPDAGGTLTGTPSGSYSEGHSVSITATANTGYTFTGFTVTGVSYHQTGTNCSFTMPDNAVSVTANFTSGTGTYTDLVNSAVKVNARNSLGDFAEMGFQINRGSTTYFLIDPKNTGGYVFNPLVTKMQIVIEDLGLGMVWTAGLTVEVTELTSNNDFALLYPSTRFIFSGGMARLYALYNQTKYSAGNKFLVKITEPNLGSGYINVKWR